LNAIRYLLESFDHPEAPRSPNRKTPQDMAILKAADAPSTGLSRVPQDNRLPSIDELTGTSGTTSAKTKPGELQVAGIPKSHLIPRNGTDLLGYTFREGLGHGFQFSRRPQI
jgi:hypothetical protein